MIQLNNLHQLNPALFQLSDSAPDFWIRYLFWIEKNTFNTYFVTSLIGSFFLLFGIRLSSYALWSQPSNFENGLEIVFKVFQILGLLILFSVILAIFNHQYEMLGFNVQPYPSHAIESLDYGGIYISLVLGLLLGVMVAVTYAKYMFKNTNFGPGLRDINDIPKLFSCMQSFDTKKFIDINKGIFIGLEAGSKSNQLQTPIYIPCLMFSQTHAQILGSSGSGKGIALGVLGYQFILNHESLIVFDPKGDARLPLVLSEAASLRGAHFIHIDLQASAVCQFNLLEDANALEIEEILVAGLGLQPSAGEGNYYRGIDQDAAEQVSKMACDNKLIQIVTLPVLLEIAQFNKKLSKADNFVRRLRQVCELAVIQTSHPIEIKKHIEQASVIYIRGSTDNHRVKMLQTMLLIRILQIIKSRPRGGHLSNPFKPVCMILDEFKHILSPVALDMLGVVREMGCHALLAHQSLADLGSCAGLPRKDVEPVVVDNSTIKLIFRIGDDQAARGFAEKSGQERTYKEALKPAQRSLSVQKSWSEVQHSRMSADLFLHLHRPSETENPFTAGVLFGHGLAKLFSLTPIPVKGVLSPPKAAPLSRRSAPTKPQDLI